jgi:NADH-quinone oxidoreductase subunit E
MQTTTPGSSLAPQFTAVARILESHEYNKNKLIPILQAVQDEYGYLPSEVMALVATALDIPPTHVFGVATFYSQFALEQKGKHLVRICDGTACHVKGSRDIVDALTKHLKLTDGNKTTQDMMFTVEPVYCLGACSLAPAVVINEEVHGKVTPKVACELVDQVYAIDQTYAEETR